MNPYQKNHFIEGHWLTDTQKVAYEIICTSSSEELSVRKIGEKLNYEYPENCYPLLKSLKKKGLITWVSGQTKTIRPTKMVGKPLIEVLENETTI